ncbi:MAG: hypothetical protein K6G16_01995 [Lachnospiraceae bacterium]|nr:hypothetical protein [Lachnospiraceae bacterium]
MYKKQMKLQKVFCLVSVISSALLFLYSLGIMTDLYDALYLTMRNNYDLTQTTVPGSYMYYEMQGFNRSFLYASIGLILLSCLLYVTNTHVRRRYYSGNYVSVCLYAAAVLGVTGWAHLQIEFFKTKFQAIDFDALKEHAELFNTLLLDRNSTFWFDIHYLLFAVALLAAALQVYNLVWKTKLMKEEARLLGGAGKETA